MTQVEETLRLEMRQSTKERELYTDVMLVITNSYAKVNQEYRM